MQVAQRAGEIAKELGLMTQAEQGETSPANGTSANWINLNLFSRNGSDASNSTWYSSDGSEKPEDQLAEAALQKYQQLDGAESDESDAEAAAPAAPTNASMPLPIAANHTRLNSQPGSDTDVQQTKQKSRAQRAGAKLDART